MKKVLAILILSTLLINCNSSNQKEKELLKRENELLKREIEIQKKENKTEIIKKLINNEVNSTDEIENQFEKVMSSITRKMDLIPNLVSVIKKIAPSETSILKELIENRSSLIKRLIPFSKLNEKNITILENQENKFSLTINKVQKLIDRYPLLKKNQELLELNSQLEGTINRISVEKVRYNAIVDKYKNRMIFPKFNAKTDNIKVEF